MKKVGIVTFHRSRSYGARLQAMATAVAVKQMGFEPELIDYVNGYEQKVFRWKKAEKYSRELARFIRMTLKRPLLHDGIYERIRFGDMPDFYRRFFSKESYRSASRLDGVRYDILLAGSDQIWNPDITGKLDPVYLLDFGDAGRRISYASSMGTHEPTPEEQELFRRCLSRFSAVSAREESSARMLSVLLDREVPVMPDPALLLSSSEWNALLSPYRQISIPGHKYILTFFVGGSTGTYSHKIKPVKDSLGLPVLNIQGNRYRHPGTDLAIADAGVADFAALIKNAAYVITDSLHGTIFSVLFQKAFTALRNEKNPSRVRELLERLGMDSRYENITGDFMQDIPYDDTLTRLEALRGIGRDWLFKSLSGKI